MMKRLKNNETIEVLGASFNGVKDMIEHARMRMPKDGVYVGEDSQYLNNACAHAIRALDKKADSLNKR